jgi:hypothetical protein
VKTLTFTVFVEVAISTLQRATLCK